MVWSHGEERGSEALKRGVRVEMPVCCPPGSPRKTRKQSVEENLVARGIKEAEAMDRDG